MSENRSLQVQVLEMLIKTLKSTEILIPAVFGYFEIIKWKKIKIEDLSPDEASRAKRYDQRSRFSKN